MEQIQYYATDHDQLSLIEAKYQKFAFQRHYHLDFHLGLITHGTQKFQYQGCSHQVGHGQIVIMPPDELHDGHSKLESGYEVNVFAIEPRLLSDLADLSQNGQIIRFNELIISDPQIFSQLSNLHALLRRDNLSQLTKDCLPFEGFNQLFDRYGSLARQKVVPLGKQSLHTLKDYLMANLDQTVRLDALSELCQLSPTQFQRHFKAQTGMTPYAWFARLRLEQGMKLLQAGWCGTDVAYQVGFYDQAHFSKAFKQTYGVSPSQVAR
ncbi:MULTISPECIES: AraC family transcriptional regulator [Vibrio]|uniref:AraC family transcriptional regulator n=1 Tax=Vibrio TaxID=662 RepID=UPI001482BA92|nr:MULTISPECIES: AraC family transcriptional regulator [Vibrio]MCS0325095.1 AraC family transcriptional regulator [Vibrio diabolicus]MCS0407842.1 AraC family transcriptional regulator [Vibrio diabolicus]